MSDANILATALEKMASQQAPIKVGNHSVVVVPDDYSVVDLEKYQNTPARKTGTVFLHTVGSLIQYVNRHKDARTQIYAEVDPPKFVAVLNDHVPGAAQQPHFPPDEGGQFGDHRALYDAPLSKEWGIWKNYAGKRMSQEDFALFLEQNILDIHKPASGAMLEIARTLQAKTKAEFKSGVNLANGAIQIGFTEEVNGTAGVEGNTQIPEEFIIGIPVFQGGGAFGLTAKFRYRISDGKLCLWYDLIRPHKVLEDAVLHIVASIEATDKPEKPAAVKDETTGEITQPDTPLPGTGIQVLYGKPAGPRTNG